MTSATPIVNTYNGWDPLKEVIVGSVSQGACPGYEPALRPYVTDAGDQEYGAKRRSDDELKLAEEQLDAFAEILQQEGVVVKRPAPMDFFTEVRTPTFDVQSQNTSSCPRDVLLIVGDEIIEASMAMRSRFFEYLPYRPLVAEYFNSGARWSAAPKPSMSDSMYVGDFSTVDIRFDADNNPSLSDAEPCFDAASFARFGRDIFYQPDIVTNDFGARWLARHLGPEFRLHRVKFDDPHPQHIDATMVPLRAGLVMMNPDRLPVDGTIELFEENGWEVVMAPRSVRDNAPASAEVSSWISMNVFNVDEGTIICEEREQPMIDFLKSFGFRVIAIPFANVYKFGGSFHCCTVDVRREGSLNSYFPNLGVSDQLSLR